MMDPTSYLNQLKQLMDFYGQNGPQPLVTGPGGDSASAWNQKLMQRNGFNFASGMLGGQQQGRPGPMPDYFAQPPQYQAPSYTAPNSVPPNPAPNPRFPMVNGGPTPPPQPYTGGINYLQQLLGMAPGPRPTFTGGARG